MPDQTTLSVDQRVMRRARPYLEQACRDPDQPAALKRYLEQGMPGLSMEWTGPEWIAWRAGAGGPVFCELDSRIVGLWALERPDGTTGLVYLRDEVLDDDLGPGMVDLDGDGDPGTS